ncbi:MAG: efflux RND transporter permease subunit, partial [Hyphomicrobiales bacterium]
VAPLAFACILLLVWILFREPSFLAPVALMALLSVVWTMGALIGTGNTVHIMSSMIPVFLMPIAILDSIHILSEFDGRRRAGGDRRTTLREAMRPLYRPMAFTSITSAVGFASLGLAFIPPVRVFGLFVGVGIAIAWVLTHTLLPALFAVLPLRPPAPAPSPAPGGTAPRGATAAALRAIGAFAFGRARLVLIAVVLLLVAGAAGIARLRSDDNPVRWFRPGHPVRVADDELNARFGGTYMANVVVRGDADRAMQRPDVMKWIARLEDRLETDPAVGKVSSVADIVRRINRVVHDGDPAYDRVPDSEAGIGQLLFIFQGSGNPDDLDHLVTPGGHQANLWVQLKDGDNDAMQRVEALAARFEREDPPPPGITASWSGLNHINVIWQHLMVRGMLQAILGSFAVVFALMVLEFRSWRLGLLAMLPLTVAISVAYGAIGLLGKAYDMPIAVCSSLSLGLAVDFAIHFLERFRARWRESGDLEDANRHVFGAPGVAIARNAIVISLGFLPLVVSSLTPYITVGLFFATLMIAGALATLFVLPAMLRVAGPGALR